MAKKTTGVQEWSNCSISIQYGCFNHCRYCWGEKMAKRFGRVPEKGWEFPNLKSKVPLPRNKKVMCFGTHDIDEHNIKEVIEVIMQLLDRGNQILIVSKPRIKPIQKLVAFFLGYRDRIEFRFSIGSQNDEVLKYWEPNAPGYKERMECIKETSTHGFITSISCEPLLDNIIHMDSTHTHYFGIPLIEELILLNGVYPIKEIWIGAIQYMKGPELDYKAIYEGYKSNPRIRFKDSFFKQAKAQGVVLE